MPTAQPLPDFKAWLQDTGNGELQEPDFNNPTFCRAYHFVLEKVLRKDFYGIDESPKWKLPQGIKRNYIIPTPRWAEKYLTAVATVFKAGGWVCDHGPYSVNADMAHAFFIYEPVENYQGHQG